MQHKDEATPHHRPLSPLPYRLLAACVVGNWLRVLLPAPLPEAALSPTLTVERTFGAIGRGTAQDAWLDFATPLLLLYVACLAACVIAGVRAMREPRRPPPAPPRRDRPRDVIGVHVLALILGHLLFVQPEILLENPKLMLLAPHLVLSVAFLTIMGALLMTWLDPGLLSAPRRRARR